MKCRLPQEYVNKYRRKGNLAPMNMSMYDLNKQMVSQMPPMSEETELQYINEILTPFITDTNNKNYMLLCRELNYFTLFHKDGNNTTSFADGIKEILSERGTLITACWADEEKKDCIEYWMKINIPIENNPDFEEVYCFMLFPYDKGTVEVC